jgi:hypothetical protein
MSHSKVEFGNQGGFNTGAGKGDGERPVNRKVFRETLDKMKKHGMRGTLALKSGIKTTYIYK